VVEAEDHLALVRDEDAACRLQQAAALAALGGLEPRGGLVLPLLRDGAWRRDLAAHVRDDLQAEDRVRHQQRRGVPAHFAPENEHEVAEGNSAPYDDEPHRGAADTANTHRAGEAGAQLAGALVQSWHCHVERVALDGASRDCHDVPLLVGFDLDGVALFRPVRSSHLELLQFWVRTFTEREERMLQ
jgi:hypothetical protein